MPFIDQDGVRKKTLHEYDLKTLETIRFQCFRFVFGPMKEVDTTSIMSKMQHFHDRGIFDANEFLNFLQVRKIVFYLKWIPCFALTRKENLRQFLLIAKWNLKH